MKVAVLMGGRSPESAVSRESGANVALALKQAGFNVVVMEAGTELALDLRREGVDVAFLATHGPFGEDGTLQGLLEFMEIPYTGSGVLASALAMHKGMAKAIFKLEGIPTAPSVTWTDADMASESDLVERLAARGLALPLVVKPCEAGSAIGVTIVREASALAAACRLALEYGAEIVVESFVPGVEITVGVLGAEELQALPCLEIVPHGEFYTFQTKYAQGGSDHPLARLRLPQPVLDRVSEIAIHAHRALGCYGMSRVDMIVSTPGARNGTAETYGEIYVLEVNTLPGMTGTSLYPQACGEIGISMADMVRMQVEWAQKRLTASRRSGKEMPLPVSGPPA